MKSPASILLLLVISARLFAQDVSTAEISDSMRTHTLTEVQIYQKRFHSQEERMAFEKLKRNTVKVYPYVMMAVEIHEQMKEDISDLNRKREKKKYVNEKEKELRERFEKEIRDMTLTQGDILIKLINRETGNNCYQIVKDMKGPVTAFFWNLAGKMYDHNLKEKYKPEENADLELVLKMIGNGQLQVKPIQ